MSDEIQHGLGEGQVSVVVGLEEIDKTILADQASTMKKVYYGQSDVFKGTEFEPDIPNVSLGTIVYPEKGTFRIGMKLQGETESAASVIAVRWWAFKSLGAAKAADQVNDEIDQGFAEAAASQQE